MGNSLTKLVYKLLRSYPMVIASLIPEAIVLKKLMYSTDNIDYQWGIWSISISGLILQEVYTIFERRYLQNAHDAGITPELLKEIDESMNGDKNNPTVSQQLRKINLLGAMNNIESTLDEYYNISNAPSLFKKNLVPTFLKQFRFIRAFGKNIDKIEDLENRFNPHKFRSSLVDKVEEESYSWKFKPLGSPEYYRTAHIVHSLKLAVKYSVLNMQDKADGVWERLGEQYQSFPDIQILHGKYLINTKRPKLAKIPISNAIKMLWSNKNEMLVPQTNSKYTTYLVTGTELLENRLFLKERNGLKDIKDEIEMSHHIKSILPNDNFVTTTPLGYAHIKESDSTKYIYALQRDDGLSLLSALRTRPKEFESSLENTVHFLSTYHAKTDLSKTNGKINFRMSLKFRLLKLEPQLVQYSNAILEAIEPIIEDFSNIFENEDDNYVANKDAHADNFGINENNQIIVYDTEKSYATSPFIDLANLLESPGNLDYQDKLGYISKYFSWFADKKPGLSSTKNPLDRAYHNAVIYRALSYASYFKDRNEHERINWIRNGVEAIEDIENNHSKFYSAHEKNYSMLKSYFISIYKTILDSRTKESSPDMAQ